MIKEEFLTSVPLVEPAQGPITLDLTSTVNNPTFDALDNTQQTIILGVLAIDGVFSLTIQGRRLTVEAHYNEQLYANVEAVLQGSGFELVGAHVESDEQRQTELWVPHHQIWTPGQRL